MSITEATLVIGAVLAVISGSWRAYQAIEDQAYERARAETRLEKAEAAAEQLAEENTELKRKLDWWERQEGPRLHERIRVLDRSLANLSRRGRSCT